MARRTEKQRRLHSEFSRVPYLNRVVTALADTAATFACRSLLGPGEEVVTIELKMNFLAGLQPGRAGMAVAQGQTLHRGRRTMVAQVKMMDSSGRLACAGLRTLLVYQVKKARKGQSGAIPGS